MEFDEIASALESTDAIPKAAMRAGVAHADRLAPRVFAVADKFCSGVYLLPEQDALLFHGLHVLAAARNPELWSCLLKIVAQPDEELDLLFSDHAPTSLTRLLLSVWDGDVDALFEMIEHGDMGPNAKWALFDVLARLTFDGRIPRERTVAFLDRVERDGLIEDGDSVWWGWEEAVTKLGARELEPALRRVWSKVINDHHSEKDHAESLEELAHTADDPTDPSVFDETDARPIDDPVEAVAWIERRAAALAEWRAERETETGSDDDDDPAGSIRLSAEERQWLAGFLVSRQAPETTMSFEMVDGLLTALAIGPTVIMPSDYLPEIWGTADGSGPVWDGMEQAQHFMNLLMKHWNAIAARRNSDAPHTPFILELGDQERGQEWAEGFMAGISLGGTSWQPMFEDRHAGEVVVSILALARHAPDLIEEPVTPEQRAGILDRLPTILRIIAAYWRYREGRPERRQPLRSKKIGRNQPCPCGSGKKYKKCCAMKAPPTLH